MANLIKFCGALKHCSIGKSKISNTISRSISLHTLNCNKYASREAKFMKKIMGIKSGGKKQWYKPHNVLPISPFPKTVTAEGPQNQRRTSVLNNVFMRHISEIMGTGELSSLLVGRGIEVLKVKMAPDFKRINVFWIAAESENDGEIEEILQKYSWKLRHELSQLRIVGEVPPLYFIKDREYSKVMEVNKILAKADFGEDYVPVDVGYRFKSEFAQTSLPLPQMDHGEQVEGKEISEHPLPTMRQDVLGLQHAEIMAKIKRGMKKAKALHRHAASEAGAKQDCTTPMVQALTSDIHLKKQDFAVFLMKQQVQRRKMSRGKKNYTPEMEIYETEVLENSMVSADFLDKIDKDQDYIEEIDDQKM